MPYLSHMCRLNTTYGPKMNANIWDKCFNFRSDPEENFPPILKVWRNVCGYDLALMHFAMPYLSHMCQLNTTYGPKVDAINLLDSLVSDQIPAKLMTFPSVSAVLCVYW